MSPATPARGFVTNVILPGPQNNLQARLFFILHALSMLSIQTTPDLVVKTHLQEVYCVVSRISSRAV